MTFENLCQPATFFHELHAAVDAVVEPRGLAAAEIERLEQLRRELAIVVSVG